MFFLFACCKINVLSDRVNMGRKAPMSWTNNARRIYYTRAKLVCCACYALRHVWVCVCVCIPRPRNHSNGPVQPLHKQQLRGSSHLSPFLRPHPLRICLLPLQAQVSSFDHAHPSGERRRQRAERSAKPGWICLRKHAGFALASAKKLK